MKWNVAAAVGTGFFESIISQPQRARTQSPSFKFLSCLRASAFSWVASPGRLKGFELVCVGSDVLNASAAQVQNAVSHAGDGCVVRDHDGGGAQGFELI